MSIRKKVANLWAPLLQSKGNSTTQPMSQKAVSDELSQLKSDKVNYTDSLTYEEIMASTDLSGKVASAGDFYKTIRFILGDTGDKPLYSLADKVFDERVNNVVGGYYVKGNICYVNVEATPAKEIIKGFRSIFTNLPIPNTKYIVLTATSDSDDNASKIIGASMIGDKIALIVNDTLSYSGKIYIRGYYAINLV